MRRPFFSSFPIVLLLTIILISPISSHGCGGGDGGGGSGDFLDDAPSTSSVAPSGFTADFGDQEPAEAGYQVMEIAEEPSRDASAPFGMPGTTQFVEQEDYGQGGGGWSDAQAAGVQAQADAIKDLAVIGGGLAVSYVTAGAPLAAQMLAAGTYAATIGSGRDSSTGERGTNATQDAAIAAVPISPIFQSALSLAATAARDAMPETESSADPSTGFGFTYHN